MVDVPDELELTAPQARVLGCLMEKQVTTPDAYPLTLKALTAACNQTSSRDPVVQYEPQLVETTLLALKGFAAAMLGGMGNPLGALAGGLLLGLLAAFGAGYVSSTYKDAFAFIVILAVLFVAPQGLFGRRAVERV